MNVSDWINNYNTEKTRAAARTSYTALTSYLERTEQNEKEWVEKMKEGDDTRYHLLSSLVNDVSQYVQPASVRQYYNFWKAFLRFVYSIKTYNEDARTFVKPPKIVKVTRAPLNKNTVKALCMEANQLRRAKYLVLSSSGMRMSELLNLKESDLDRKTNMVRVKGHTTKTQTERITFISEEAAKAIDETPDFWDKKTLGMEEIYFSRVRERLGFTERYDNSVVHKITLHTFRSFFRTNAGKINSDFAEALLGHGGYLKQYVRLEPEELYKDYQKLEPKIKIF